MRAVLSNPRHPEYGVATIPLPIPKEEYDNCIAVLNALEIGDAVSSDCRIEEIHCDSPILRRLESTNANVDELDYLAKRMDSFGTRELGQFQAVANSQNIHSIRDFINLTFCCQNVTIIQDFSDLKQIGEFCCMDKNGGTLSQDNMLYLDFEKVALNLLRNNKGKITPYGVIYDQDFQMAQLYDGRQFPQYSYDECMMEVEMIPDQLPQEHIPSTFLSLPMPEQGLERAMLRGDCLEGDVQLRFLDSRLPTEIDVLIDFEQTDIVALNSLCHAVSKLDEGAMKKLGAAVSFAEPTSAEGVRNLAEQLDLFDFIPGIRTPEEYGRHMIAESGHFEYDENLEGYYNFEKYGLQRVEQEYGKFCAGGYISYHGVVSFGELLAGVNCERMEMGGMA